MIGLIGIRPQEWEVHLIQLLTVENFVYCSIGNNKGSENGSARQFSSRGYRLLVRHAQVNFRHPIADRCIGIATSVVVELVAFESATAAEVAIHYVRGQLVGCDRAIAVPDFPSAPLGAKPPALIRFAAGRVVESKLIFPRQLASLPMTG